MSLFDDPKPNNIENWVCVKESSTELEISMYKNYLSNLKIPSNILSKRDTAYSLGVGDMALVYLYVPKEFEKKARTALTELDEAEDVSAEESGEDA